MKQINLQKIQTKLRKKFITLGVKMVGPETIFFSEDTQIGKNVVINPYVVIGKKVKLHKIESLVSFIELHDLIYLKLTKKKDHKISFKGKFSKNINKRNTVTSLLKLLDKKNFLNNQKFEIIVIKNIPQEAGMGGGSMNAANLINFFIKKKILKLSNN